MMTSSPGRNQYLMSFGVLTDVQYADHDDKRSWCSPSWRYYRNSLNLVQEAFETWMESFRPIQFVLQLGDLIDALNNRLNLNSHEALSKVLSTFAKFPSIPTYHALGNHELYNFSREELLKLSFQVPDVKSSKHINPVFGSRENRNEPASHNAYFSFSPIPELVFIVLDCLDVSMLGYDSGHPNLKAAEECLEKYHPHGDKSKYWQDDHLCGLERRFVDYNGGIGPEQMQWLHNELKLIQKSKKKAIICGHIPLLPSSTHETSLLWNYDEVLCLFHQHSNSIIAYLAGHYHHSGFATDSHGIHHFTLAGIVETSPDTNAFCTVHVFNDHLEIQGYGRVKCYNLPF